MGRRRRHTIKPSIPWMTMPVPWRWSDLPDDLLRIIHSKVAGPVPRVRFTAVCKSWRAAATSTPRLPAPPALPWLIFSSDNGKTRRVYCPEKGGVLRFPLRSQAVTRKRLVGAHDGGWVAAIGDKRKLEIVNLISGAEVSFPATDSRTLSSDNVKDIHKVVFSEPPTSRTCIVAAVTRRYITICTIGCPGSTWTSKEIDYRPMTTLVDIIFFNGHIYCTTLLDTLVKFEISVSKEGTPVIACEHHRMRTRNVDSTLTLFYQNYIVELHGNLAMVTRVLPSYDGWGEPFFKVFELAEDESTTIEFTHKWKELTSLGDYALFLGEMSSKAMFVPVSGRGGVRRSYVYADDMTYLTSLDGRGDSVYPRLATTDAKRRIKSAGSYVVDQGRFRSGIWVLPPDI